MLSAGVTSALVMVLLLLGLSQGQVQNHYWSKSDSLRPLLQVLDQAKVSGSLEFTGTCDSYSFHVFPEFPRLGVPAASDESILQTVREMFADSPAMQVTLGPDETVRIVESGVATDILGVKISRVPFTGNGSDFVYSGWAALRRILETPEVKSFMETHDIQLPFDGGGTVSFNPSPPKDTPHISKPLDNATFSEAMDYILKTFPGIWIYENCQKTSTRKRTVYFRFYHLQNTGSGTIVQ
jgi:hypothetical protein